MESWHCFVIYCHFLSIVLRLSPLLCAWFLARYQIDSKVFSFIRKTDRSYQELEARRGRLSQLEKIYMDMTMQKELQVFWYFALLIVFLYVSYKCRMLNKDIPSMNRKKVGSANYVKTRLFVQQLNRYTCGVLKESVERVNNPEVLFCLFTILHDDLILLGWVRSWTIYMS